MKVIAYNGSPRADGNTRQLIDIVLKEVEAQGVESEVFQLGGRAVHGCKACYKCAQNKDRHCSVTKDVINECIEKMLVADGILIGSPTYFSNVTTEVKALIDRAGMVAKANGDMFRHKVGAGVVAVRRAGANHVYSSINYFFGINQMIIPGANYWNLAIGREKGEVYKDEEGLLTMKTLGQNMAWLIKKLSG